MLLWMDKILHHPRNHDKPWFVGIYRVVPKRISSIHSRTHVGSPKEGYTTRASREPEPQVADPPGPGLRELPRASVDFAHFLGLDPFQWCFGPFCWPVNSGNEEEHFILLSFPRKGD